ncbi:MAG: hypothetical protein QM704_06550 [Anaeromyxobacteraceae bacterium]
MFTAERPPEPAAGQDAPPAAAMDHVPKGTTPTWEMELLLSGATVFGLLQLPGVIDPPFFKLMMRLDDGLGPGVTVLWLYLRTSILTLSATFVVHLALRAYWAALVGMRSVYPGPIRWERLRVGPIQREAVERDLADVEARIEASDNRATRVFGLGVAAAFLILLPLAFVAVGVGLGWAIHRLGGPEATPSTIFAALGVLIVPFAVLAFVDRRLGKRIGPGRLRRGLASAFRAYYRIGFGGAANPLVALFQSAEGTARTMFILVGTMVLAIVLVMNQFRAAMGDETVGDYAGLPEDDAGALQSSSPQHYASQRQPGLVLPVPYIPDRVVKGPYVELLRAVPPRPPRARDARGVRRGGVGGRARGPARRGARLPRPHPRRPARRRAGLGAARGVRRSLERRARGRPDDPGAGPRARPPRAHRRPARAQGRREARRALPHPVLEVARVRPLRRQ